MKPPADWLSSLINMMTIQGRLETRCSYGAPWEIEYQDAHTGEIPYHVILAGKAVLESVGSESRQELYAGDIIMLPHGSRHLLHDGSGHSPALVTNRTDLNFTFSENTGTGDRLEMLCGRFLLPPPYDRFFREYFPSILIARTTHGENQETSESSAQLNRLLLLMRSEAGNSFIGSYAMVNSLSTALFTLTLRKASESIDAPIGLLALVNQPRLIPALTAMFNNPSHPWTLPKLANLCNMSRATMVRHFEERVGHSASKLLMMVRMTIAANELKTPNISTEAVAEMVGYQSTAAFRRAFNHYIGMPPGEWRRYYIKDTNS